MINPRHIKWSQVVENDWLAKTWGRYNHPSISPDPHADNDVSVNEFNYGDSTMNRLHLCGCMLLSTLAACGSDDNTTLEKSAASVEEASQQAKGMNAGDAEAARQAAAKRLQESINSAY
jgi:hypothetical protein